MGRLENQINATSYSNIGSLKSAFEEQWNKMFEKFILKACKFFQGRVDTMIEKKEWWPYWENLLFCVFVLLWLFIFLN